MNISNFRKVRKFFYLLKQWFCIIDNNFIWLNISCYFTYKICYFKSQESSSLFIVVSFKPFYRLHNNTYIVGF